MDVHRPDRGDHRSQLIADPKNQPRTQIGVPLVTAPRGNISESQRTADGQIWVNEVGAATLCGLSYRQYRRKVSALEAQGFPRKNPIIGKRPRQAILAFFGLTTNDYPSAPEDERKKEVWDEPVHRRAQR